MEPTLGQADWRKSSYSGGTGNCVEVAGNLPGIVAVRDSWDPAGPALVFTPAEWEALTRMVRSAKLDLPAGQPDLRGFLARPRGRRRRRRVTARRLPPGRILAVDWTPQDHRWPEGVFFVYDGGTLSKADIASITVQDGELDGFRFAASDEIGSLVNPPLARRIESAFLALRSGSVLSLENGHPIELASLRDDFRFTQARPDCPARCSEVRQLILQVAPGQPVVTDRSYNKTGSGSARRCRRLRPAGRGTARSRRAPQCTGRRAARPGTRRRSPPNGRTEGFRVVPGTGSAGCPAGPLHNRGHEPPQTGRLGLSAPGPQSIPDPSRVLASVIGSCG